MASAVSLRAGRGLTIALVATLAFAGCRTGRNYATGTAPRTFAPVPSETSSSPAVLEMPDTLRLVTFNVKYAIAIDQAIRALTTDADLRDADVVLLQEMDSAGSSRIAAALRMGFVYYPATYHLKNKRGFGNAVLSRWPILADTRIELPHLSHVTRTQRAATAATLLIGERRVRIYSVHLGTMVDVRPSERREQLERVIADAMLSPYVIIAGDMNSAGVGPVARQFGFAWLTSQTPRTTSVGRWDHVFTRGFEYSGAPPVGVSRSSRAASDHSAVWARIPMRARGAR